MLLKVWNLLNLEIVIFETQMSRALSINGTKYLQAKLTECWTYILYINHIVLE